MEEEKPHETRQKLSNVTMQQHIIVVMHLEFSADTADPWKSFRQEFVFF